MWLTNYKKMKLADALMCVTKSTDTSVVSVKDCSGASISSIAGTGMMRVNGRFYTSPCSQTTQVYNGLSNRDGEIYPFMFFHIGSGTTKETAGDYKMEQEITTGFSIVPQYVANTDNYSLKRCVIITNTSESEMTISEIGITVFSGSVYQGNTNYSQTLIYREVLSTPISLEVGESAKFIITDY